MTLGHTFNICNMLENVYLKTKLNREMLYLHRFLYFLLLIGF